MCVDPLGKCHDANVRLIQYQSNIEKLHKNKVSQETLVAKVRSKLFYVCPATNVS